MQWTPSLEVGVSFMDSDHEHAVETITAMKTVDVDKLSKVLGEFYVHCKEHFAREEEMMKRISFPAYECHKAEHERVLEEIGDHLEMLEAKTSDLNGDALYTHWLQWFVNHRNTMDFVTANYARQQDFDVAV